MHLLYEETLLVTPVTTGMIGTITPCFSFLSTIPSPANPLSPHMIQAHGEIYIIVTTHNFKKPEIKMTASFFLKKRSFSS